MSSDIRNSANYDNPLPTINKLIYLVPYSYQEWRRDRDSFTQVMATENFDLYIYTICVRNDSAL